MAINISDIFSREYKKAKVYTAPLHEEVGIRLYMNENQFAPSKECLKVLEDVERSDLYQYQIGGNSFLERKLANFYKINEDNLNVTNGSAMAIYQIFSSVVKEGDCVMLPNPGWSYYEGISNLVGAKIIKTDLFVHGNRYKYNVEEILNKVTELNPKLVVITSPNMPSGNVISYSEVQKIANKLCNGLLVLDQAYIEFSDSGYDDFISLLEENENVVITRTFSKFYGLANARVGYMIGNAKLINLFKKSNDLFGISGLSQKVAAFALNDIEFNENMRNEVAAVRNEFIAAVNQLTNFKAYESSSNFVLINLGEISSDYVCNEIRKEGFIIRDCKGYNLHNHVRISIGKKMHMKCIVDILIRISNEQANH